MFQFKHVFLFVLIIFIACNAKEKQCEEIESCVDSYSYLRDESIDDENAGEGGGSFYTQSLLKLDKVANTYDFSINYRSGCEVFDFKSEGDWRLKNNTITFYTSTQKRFDKVKAIIKDNTIRFQIPQKEGISLDKKHFYSILKEIILMKNENDTTVSSCKIKVEWVEHLNGDFSFKEKWSYPEGIYRNKFGQLSCDGLCPAEVEKMKDEEGKIYTDSLRAFYKLVDTTHIAYSLKSEISMYECSGTNFISFRKENNGKIIGTSLANASTHSMLNIELQNNYCSVWVDFNSIAGVGQSTFPLDKGAIRIDKSLYQQGVIKAFFAFKLKNTYDASDGLFWKGQIYAIVKNETNIK